MTYEPRSFDDVAKLPAPGDNAAIATERLEAGTEIERDGEKFTISHTVLEGHRFATEKLAKGDRLFSWGLTFGDVVKEIRPGDYACNEKILKALTERKVDFDLPDEPNFRDAELTAYELDEESFRPGEQVPLHEHPATFLGYRREGGRGVGTRNYIVLIGVTSRTGGFAKALEHKLRDAAKDYDDIDGIVAVAHTEGGEDDAPNNLDLLLRTLSGFIVNPNVGAALVMDEEFGAVTNDAIRSYMQEHDYPLDAVKHEFMTLGRSFGLDLKSAGEKVRGWLDEVGAARRTEEPLSELKVALQCGGSDAFSGVSANPLVGWVSKEIVKNGGTAVLAETDELIGAESYALANVRELDVAKRFLSMVERFKERVGWHGHTAEGNPSGGNNYRGLYNISIKSIGAATKRDPELRLDDVIEYSEPLEDRTGYLFMDSPGNDLESVAGQMASGCNMVFFTTGNGSITNFPFVPTVKIVTTTGRYEMLRAEMDVNAGAYLDGEPLEEVGMEMFDLTLRAASGERTAGEKAGHSQVSIWRNWRQTDDSNLSEIQNRPEPDGEPLPLVVDVPASEATFDAIRTSRGYAADQVGLVMPTSLCSGQIAVRISDLLNGSNFDRDRLSRFVALPHTEGCGSSGGASEQLYSRTVLGHLASPLVRFGLLLEHGCEKTHNDYFHARLREAGLTPDDFGWASVQLDGGIDAVVEKVSDWFDEKLDAAPELETKPVGLEHLCIGLDASGPLSDIAAKSLADLAATVVSSGGTVVVPERSPLLASDVFVKNTVGEFHVTLAHGEQARESGFHVMESPTNDPIEAATGLAATGVEVMISHVSGRPLPAHRMVPLVQVSSDAKTLERYGDDLDLHLEDEPDDRAERMLDLIIEVASRRYEPRLFGQGNVGFQFTRGLLGVSM